MSEANSFAQALRDAPPGVVMTGQITMIKASSGRIQMVAEVGGQEFKKIIPPAFIDAIDGKGPLGFLRKMFTKFSADEGR
jgi:hypothetical protein